MLLCSTLVSPVADNILTKLVSSKLRDDALDIYQLVAAIEMKKAYMVTAVVALRGNCIRLLADRYSARSEDFWEYRH